MATTRVVAVVAADGVQISKINLVWTPNGLHGARFIHLAIYANGCKCLKQGG